MNIDTAEVDGLYACKCWVGNSVSLSLSNQQLKGKSSFSQSCEDRLSHIDRIMAPKDLHIPGNYEYACGKRELQLLDS